MVAFEIRASRQGDLSAIETLYPAAFPEEDLLPLVRTLLKDPSPAVSLVAISGSSLQGHVLFTLCRLDPGGEGVALLGPLAVAPAHQRQGIGSGLVRAGLSEMQHAGMRGVCVLGDPAYYGRLGFQEENGIRPPYPLPAEWRGAWQSLSFDETGPFLQGTLAVPEPWRQPALWGP